jgi:hypothetical protein
MDPIKQFINKLPIFIKNNSLIDESKKLMKSLSGYQLSTIQTMLTPVRNAIKAQLSDNNVKKEAFSILRIPKEEQVKIRERGNTKQRKSISPKQVDEFIDKIQKSNLDDIEYYEYTVFLLVVSGRRTFEIVNSAKFSKINETIVEVGGLLKKREKTDISIRIPVLVKTDYFMKAFKFYRKKFDDSKMTDKQVNSKYSPMINRRVKTIFNDKALTAHDMRRVYVMMAYDRFPQLAKKRDFIRDVLGHSEPEHTPADHYMNMELKKDD